MSPKSSQENLSTTKSGNAKHSNSNNHIRRSISTGNSQMPYTNNNIVANENAHGQGESTSGGQEQGGVGSAEEQSQFDTDDQQVDPVNRGVRNGRNRGIRVEDILWWICLFFTARCFDLPAALIFSKKINRFFLKVALLSPFLLIMLTIFYVLAKAIFRNWTSKWFRTIQLCAVICFLITPICFCIATWELFGLWSIFISYVGVQSALAFIALI